MHDDDQMAEVRRHRRREAVTRESLRSALATGDTDSLRAAVEDILDGAF